MKRDAWQSKGGWDDHYFCLPGIHSSVFLLQHDFHFDPLTHPIASYQIPLQLKLATAAVSVG